MLAYVEQPDKSYIWLEMGSPECGEYCDGCGDCLACQYHSEAEWCTSNYGESFWVIYLDDPKNPNNLKEKNDNSPGESCPSEAS